MLLVEMELLVDDVLIEDDVELVLILVEVD